MRIGLTVALWAGAALAQQGAKVLTLQDCIQLAESAQSIVSVARQDVEVARRGLTVARSGFLPRTNIASGYIYNSPMPGSGEFSFIALNGVREYVSQFTAAEEFDTSGRLRAALSRARADRDAAGANLALVGRDLRRAVAAAYYRLLLTRRLVEVNRGALDEASSFERRTRLLFQNGEAAQADVVKAASQVAFLEQAQRAAELEAQTANYELAAFWTEDVSAPLAIQDVLDQPAAPPETEAAGARPFMRRLEFSLLDAQRRGFLADVRQARAQLFPQLSMVFQYGLDATRVSFRERGYAAFLNLNIPVFDWMRSRSEARQFESRARQVEANRAIATRNFSRDYESALARVRSLYDQIAMTARQVQLSEENLKLSRLRYEGGEGSALDVVVAQTQLTQARTNHYTAVAAYWNARADLEIASGR